MPRIPRAARRFIGSVFLIVTTSIVVSGQIGSTDRVTHQRLSLESDRALELYRQLPAPRQLEIERLARREGVALPKTLADLAAQQQLGRRLDERIFRGIKDELKPIPISGGQLLEVFRTRDLPLAAIPTGADADRVLRRAASVGRIEIAEAQVHVGTGFVVADGLIATNCHMLSKIGQRQPNGQWALAPNTRYLIDFGGVRSHQRTREHVIEGVAAYSLKPFMDVALLKVSLRSVSGDHNLPEPIPLRTSRLDMTGMPLKVSVVGYPNLLAPASEVDRLTRQLFLPIWESSIDHVKVLSPGEVIGIDPHGDIDFLDHIASTQEGQSGSPVLDAATGEAVGLHFCCSTPGVPQRTEELACSSQRVSDRENNEAVSSWTTLTDETLKPFFPTRSTGRRLMELFPGLSQ